MSNKLQLRDDTTLSSDSIKDLDADVYYMHLRTNISEIQKKYVKWAMGILDGEVTEETIREFGSKIEVLPLVDENDKPYRNNSGLWSSEFRQDYMNYDSLPESKERTIISRVTLFILEDNDGNIIVSRRSPNKSHPNMLEIPGGHVTVWYDYLETCIKELEEELKYTPDSLSEWDRLFKFRNSSPDPKPGTYGRWTIMTIYRAKVPSIDSLKPLVAEIAELITMSPLELLNAIKSKKDNYKFEVNHAFMYLEYLKNRLPERIYDISQEQMKLSHTLTLLELFSSQEITSNNT